MKIYRLSAITDDAHQRIRQHETSLLESFTTGDYELYVLVAEGYFGERMKENGLPIFQLAIQKSDRDFTVIDQQMTKYPMKTEKDIPNIKKTISEIKNKIAEWLGHYGQLCASSFSKERTDHYKKILTQMEVPYTVKPLMGLEVIVIG